MEKEITLSVPLCILKEKSKGLYTVCAQVLIKIPWKSTRSSAQGRGFDLSILKKDWVPKCQS